MNAAFHHSAAHLHLQPRNCIELDVLKNKAPSWKDYFFEEAQGTEGSDRRMTRSFTKGMHERAER
ncbi:hypothetical protein CU668_07320 [Pseudomonas syringae pv. actinidifoliorum]|nr:hypothetical protein [Pseudomonas syringae pv. actinidifoliorum]